MVTPPNMKSLPRMNCQYAIRNEHISKDVKRVLSRRNLRKSHLPFSFILLIQQSALHFWRLAISYWLLNNISFTWSEKVERSVKPSAENLSLVCLTFQIPIDKHQIFLWGPSFALWKINGLLAHFYPWWMVFFPNGAIR